MTIQDLGSIGELIAALVTLATLVYLAVQIRQNIRTVRASTYHAGSTAWSGLVTQLAADPRLSEIYHLGCVSPEALSEEDTRRFELIYDAMLAQIENFYTQYVNGHLPKSNQDRFARVLRQQFRTPGVQRHWSKRRMFFTTEFVQYVENELELTRSNTQ